MRHPNILLAPAAPAPPLFGIGFVLKFGAAIAVLCGLVYAVYATYRAEPNASAAPAPAEGDGADADADADADPDLDDVRRAIAENARAKAPPPPKHEYCYVGEHAGVRSCAPVGQSECMSGDIFPTEKQCVNPNLRYM